MLTVRLWSQDLSRPINSIALKRLFMTHKKTDLKVGFFHH